jgi:hypothetical protein
MPSPPVERDSASSTACAGSVRQAVIPRSAIRYRGPRAKNVALCGLPLDVFRALFVQGRIAYSVDSGSEKSVSDARSVNAGAAPSTRRVPKAPLGSTFGPSPQGEASP